MINNNNNNNNIKVTSNKSNYLLTENKFKKLQTFDLGLFIGQSYFNNHGAQSMYKSHSTYV